MNNPHRSFTKSVIVATGRVRIGFRRPFRPVPEIGTGIAGTADRITQVHFPASRQADDSGGRTVAVAGGDPAI